MPCYNDGTVVAECHRRLAAAFAPLAISYECIYVDDGSRDPTWLQFSKLHEQFPHNTVAVTLSRNFGHQSAVSTGLSLTRGKVAVIIIDADLQDPPELIPPTIDTWRQGNEVVYGVRSSLVGHQPTLRRRNPVPKSEISR